MNKEVQKLISAGGVLVGSAGLGLENPKDYDVAICSNDLPTKYSSCSRIDMKKYFSIVPMGNNYLIKPTKELDILVFESYQVFGMVVDAMSDCLKVPKYIMEDKDRRIYLFEAALKNYGFDK